MSFRRSPFVIPTEEESKASNSTRCGRPLLRRGDKESIGGDKANVEVTTKVMFQHFEEAFLVIATETLCHSDEGG
ncbi:MAG: hypothetical protein ACK41O_10855, partial [Runella zeae]